MTIRSSSYREEFLEALTDRVEAAHYVNAALRDSLPSFLMALKDVAQAKQLARVAKDAGVQRETLYRSLSDRGNPTLETFSSVLHALGFRFEVVPEDIVDAGATAPPAPNVEYARATNVEINPLDGSEEQKFFVPALSEGGQPKSPYRPEVFA
jgi:probable addiction module antidote protein